MRPGICIISQYWEPDVGGDVTRLRHAVDILGELGHKVLLITTAPHYPSGDSKGYRIRFVKLEREGNLTVIRFKMPPISHTGFARRLVIHSWFSCLSAIAALVFGRRGYVWAFGPKIFSTYSSLPAKLIWRAKLVSDVSDIWPEALVNTGYAIESSASYKLERFLAKVAYRMSDIVTTITPAQSALLTAGYKVPSERVVLIPNVGRRLSHGDVRGNGIFRVLYFGNLGENYDFEPVLETAYYLQEEVEFVIRGSGEGLSAIRRTISRLKLKNVTVLEQPLNTTQLSELVDSADAFMLPVRKQPFPDASFPIKFAEYLWNPKPIIFWGDGYLRELITSRRIGVAATNDDPEDAATQIRILRENPENLVGIKSRAAELADEQFSYSSVTKMILGVFGRGTEHGQGNSSDSTRLPSS